MSFTAADHRAWLSERDCDLDRLPRARRADGPTSPTTRTPRPWSRTSWSTTASGSAPRPSGTAVQAELVRALADGPGIVVFEGAFPDPSVVDRLTDVFDALIAEQRASGASAGDHFAKPGANDRVWNALEKAALYDPEAFADYYANDVLALVSDGLARPRLPGHLAGQRGQPGRRGADRAPRLPPRLPRPTRSRPPTRRMCTALSPVLTLQGAVAHCDMPVESGPTLYLPYSQKYEPGYLAWRLPEFQAYFEAQPRPAPPRQGRRGLLQPRAVPRGRHQPLGGHPAHGQPAAGVLRLRAGHGDGGPRGRRERGLPRAAAGAGPRASARSGWRT